MGLDQWALMRKDGEKDIKFVYWRKHNRLEGWMRRLYYQRGGTKEFNNIELELAKDDILVLQEAVANKMLPETQGFFFGDDSYIDYDNDNHGYQSQDLAFLTAARAALAKGYQVFYCSSW